MDTIELTHDDSSVIGGTGTMTIINYAQGDRVTVTGGAGSLNYAQGLGSAIIALGSGDASLNGGYGGLTVDGGAGNITLVGGEGSNDFTAGSGSADVMTSAHGGNIVFGAGNTCVTTLGYGSAIAFQFAGRGGGTDTIYNYRQGVDTLSLGSRHVTSTTLVNGSTHLTLCDNTTIIFVGENVMP